MPFLKRFASDLFQTDGFKSKYWILVFAAYAILLAVVVSRHEPWMDEAQPWLLVNHFSTTELFAK